MTDGAVGESVGEVVGEVWSRAVLEDDLKLEDVVVLVYAAVALPEIASRLQSRGLPSRGPL